MSKMSKWYGIMTVVVVMALSAAPVLGQTVYTSSQSGPWNDVNTWGGGGYPDDGSTGTDTVNINADGHTVTYNAGTRTIADLDIGDTAGNTVGLDIQSGTLTVGGDAGNGQWGIPTIDIRSGATMVFVNQVTWAHRGTARVTLNVHSGGTMLANGTMTFGGGDQYAMETTMNVVGGTAAFADDTRVGSGGGAGTGFGKWNLTNATINVADWLGVGVNADYNNADLRGYVYQTGGTVNVATNTTDGGLRVAGYADPTAIGVYEISGGGTLSLKGSNSDFWFGNGGVSNAEFHVSGSANTIEVADEFVGWGHATDVSKVLVRFTADAGGASPIECGGNVKLAEGGNGIALNVDLTSYDLESSGDVVTLWTYPNTKTQTGAFGVTNVTGVSSYELDYAYSVNAGTNAVALKNLRLPPDGTLFWQQ
jgi:hypothetical protein